MAAKLIILLACIALSQAHLVRRDAPASSPLEDLEKRAAEFQKAFSEQFQALVNSKNAQEVNKALKDGSDAVLKQLSSLSSSLQGALTDANGKAKEALEQTRANVERAAEDLRRSHPDVEKNAVELREKLQSVVQNTVQETQKLVKEVASNVEATNQKLAPKIKEAFDDFVKQAEEMQKKVHDAASKQLSTSSEDADKALKESTDCLLQQLSTLSSRLQIALSEAEGKEKEALENARVIVEKKSEELRQAQVDVQRQASELHERLRAAVSSAVQETHKLAREVANDLDTSQLTPALTEALNTFVTEAEVMLRQVYDAVSKQ